MLRWPAIPVLDELVSSALHSFERSFPRRLLGDHQDASLFAALPQLCFADASALWRLLEFNPAIPALRKIDIYQGSRHRLSSIGRAR